MKKGVIICLLFLLVGHIHVLACCTRLTNAGFIPGINDSTRIELTVFFTLGPPAPPFDGFETDIIADTLKVKLLYDLSGNHGSFQSSRIDTINLGIVPNNINAIHILPYSWTIDTGTADTTFEGRDTVLLTALSVKPVKQDRSIIVMPNPVKNTLHLSA